MENPATSMTVVGCDQPIPWNSPVLLKDTIYLQFQDEPL